MSAPLPLDAIHRWRQYGASLLSRWRHLRDGRHWTYRGTKDARLLLREARFAFTGAARLARLGTPSKVRRWEEAWARREGADSCCQPVADGVDSGHATNTRDAAAGGEGGTRAAQEEHARRSGCAAQRRTLYGVAVGAWRCAQDGRQAPARTDRHTLACGASRCGGAVVTYRVICLDWNDLRVRAEVSPGDRGGYDVEPCGPTLESLNVSADKGATWTSPEDAGIGAIEESKIEEEVLRLYEEVP